MSKENPGFYPLSLKELDPRIDPELGRPSSAAKTFGEFVTDLEREMGAAICAGMPRKCVKCNRPMDVVPLLPCRRHCLRCEAVNRRARNRRWRASRLAAGRAL